MKNYHALKCASFAASRTEYQDVLNPDGTKTQVKTWTFTSEDLHKFLIALEITRRGQ
jgi:hypothetical protein